MISVIVLGTGNVGTHLINTFLKTSTIELVQVYSRKESSLDFIDVKIPATTNITDLEEADIYIIAIADDAIAEFSSQLDLSNKLVVHTSGGVAMDALKTNGNKGVFYPLQTFTKNKTIDLNTVPICIEAERNEDLIVLEKLASAVSNHVFYIDSDQRKQLHVAAVFANNFVNHMYSSAHTICTENNIPFATLLPLITETARKIASDNPADVQTGPAKRNDLKTITSHLELLSGKQKEIYTLLTESIQNQYGKKL